MTFTSLKRIKAAVKFYRKNPKYCDVHNVKLKPKISNFANKQSDLRYIKFLHLVCPVDNCHGYDRVLKEWAICVPDNKLLGPTTTTESLHGVE